MADQSASLDWKENNVPVSVRFDDPYFSFEDGLAETQHVFLAGNSLPERFCDGFHIGELGFGTGLNLLTTWHEWRKSGVSGRLHFTSFEAFPIKRADMERALNAFPEISDVSKEFFEGFRGGGEVSLWDDLSFSLVVGDARKTVPNWDGIADAWFLDGFSPAKNPELWSQDLLRAVGDRTCRGGSAATYTAAGCVRRGLEAAGFSVERTRGFGRKRHMVRATRRDKI